MFFAVSNLNTKCFLNTKKKKQNPPSNLEAWHVETEDIKDKSG